MRPAASRLVSILFTDQKMIIEAIIFLVFVTAVGAAIVKIYEWRQDVLYGPYLAKRRSEPNQLR
jgi:hypothetical protein